MRRNGNLPPSWWLSDTRRQLAAHGPAHVAAYAALCTGPVSHISGVGYMPLVEIAHLIGIARDKAEAIITDMERGGIMVFDRDHSIAWLVGAIELQLGSPRWWEHDKWLKATIAYFETLPISSAVDRFLRHYRLTDRIPYRYPIDTLSVGVKTMSDRGSLSTHLSVSASPPHSPPRAAGEKNFPPLDENGLDMEGQVA